MGARALTETANPLIWSPTKTRLNPATVSRAIPMRVAKARFEPKPVDAPDRTFRRYGREADVRCARSIMAQRPEEQTFAARTCFHRRVGQVGWKAGLSFRRTDVFP
jgi:hypothetical protein